MVKIDLDYNLEKFKNNQNNKLSIKILKNIFSLKQETK